MRSSYVVTMLSHGGGGTGRRHTESITPVRGDLSIEPWKSMKRSLVVKQRGQNHESSQRFNVRRAVDLPSGGKRDLLRKESSKNKVPCEQQYGLVVVPFKVRIRLDIQPHGEEPSKAKTSRPAILRLVKGVNCKCRKP